VLGLLREHCEREGTDYDAISKTRLTPILFGRSAEEAKARAERLRPAGETAKGFAARTLLGTPEQVAEQLQAFADVGVEAFLTSFYDVDELEPLAILMQEVAPRVRGHGR
jgi:alkanesulfonate monooxygenase SsuD/methylene tetrahydromethanopterin reductase-like flavin-dependent oxidoreductase (luciferase family)